MILVTIGTRPEAIKMIPVYLALQERGADVAFVNTGQHDDLDSFLKEFSIQSPKSFYLNARANRQYQNSPTLAHQFGEMLRLCSNFLASLIGTIDAVLVQGDTLTVLAMGLAAKLAGIEVVGHVEAGLRTYQHNPFPEELNRVLMADIATHHFCPSEVEKTQLIREGVKGKIEVVGNTVVDALFLMRSEITEEPELNQALITAHRRENWPFMRTIAESVKQLAQKYHDVEFVWPLHPNPAIRQEVKAIISPADRARYGVTLTEPLSYRETVQSMLASYVVLTDSGGIQEECACLGVPFVVLRAATERPAALQCGKLVDPALGKDEIVSVFESILGDRQQYTTPVTTFGDGKAATRIATLLGVANEEGRQ